MGAGPILHQTSVIKEGSSTIASAHKRRNTIAIMAVIAISATSSYLTTTDFDDFFGIKTSSHYTY